MKIRHSQYELVGKNAIHSKHTHKTRHGALLQIEFDDGKIGYADCHPWKEFGDQPLKAQLELLQAGKCTRLTARSVHFAKVDANARANKVNLLEGLNPISHYTIFHINDETLTEVKKAIAQKFTHFKIKVGTDLLKEEALLVEMAKLLPEKTIRLDFNAKVSKESFISFLEKISSIRKHIEFIEDPFTYEYSSWRHVQEHYGVELAADEYYKQAFGNPESARVLIMKPAVHAVKQMDSSQKLVVTSYLDHPFGQMTAAYIAAILTNQPAGLLSHTAYETNPFSQMIQHEGSVLKPVAGFGFGFDSVLKDLEFVPLT